MNTHNGVMTLLGHFRNDVYDLIYDNAILTSDVLSSFCTSVHQFLQVYFGARTMAQLKRLQLCQH